MPVDVRINEVTTDVNVSDASSLLTPEILEQIIQAVFKRLEEKEREEQAQSDDTQLGSQNSD